MVNRPGFGVRPVKRQPLPVFRCQRTVDRRRANRRQLRQSLPLHQRQLHRNRSEPCRLADTETTVKQRFRDEATKGGVRRLHKSQSGVLTTGFQLRHSDCQPVVSLLRTGRHEEVSMAIATELNSVRVLVSGLDRTEGSPALAASRAAKARLARSPRSHQTVTLTKLPTPTDLKC